MKETLYFSNDTFINLILLGLLFLSDADVILESPALPVTEEANVTLRCREKTASLKHAAHIFKDGQLINTIYNGEMTIHSVSQYDEGLYKCRISETGESSESWLAVRGNPIMTVQYTQVHYRCSLSFVGCMYNK